MLECIPKGNESNLQKVLDGLQSWSIENNMMLNPTKTKDMGISFQKSSTQTSDALHIKDAYLERVLKFKLLGVWHQNNLGWKYHTEQTVTKAKKKDLTIYEKPEKQFNMPLEVGFTIYCIKIRRLLEYASPLWGGLSQYLADDLQRVQNRSLDIIGTARSTLPSLGERRSQYTKRELERTLNTAEHPNQVFY